MTAPARPNLDALIEDDDAALVAMREAVRRAIVEHKRLGLPIVVARDGQVVRIPPEEIPEDGVFPPEG